MFCDLVDSTILAGSLDPEDYRSILRSYHDAVARKVTSFDGFIAQFLGDGILVYFGYPHAHEDDAERAVRAALQVVQTIDVLKLQVDVKLSTKVGIATGAVVVGEIGAGHTSEPSATGDTPNLAARLQGVARAGQVVIAGSTHDLVGEVFEAQYIGPQQLKGFGAVLAWRVLRERIVSSRFEGQHAHGLSDFVGRDGELLIMLQRWEMACSGDGQVVLLSGEPGIGKSRVCQAFRVQTSNEAVSTVVIQCSPHYQGSPFYPVMHHLERASTLSPAGGDASDPESLPSRLLRSMQASQQAKPTVLNDLANYVLQLAEARPLLILIEDMHWADSATEELVALLVKRLRAARVLALVTTRPQYRPTWAHAASHRDALYRSPQPRRIRPTRAFRHRPKVLSTGN